MTDQVDLPEPQWGAGGVPDAPIEHSWPTGAVAPDPSRAGFPPAPEGYAYQLSDHKITISFSPKKEPMIVVRGNSAVEVNALLEELDAEGVYIQLAQAQQALLGSVPPAEQVMRQLGAQPMGQFPNPQASPVAQQVAQAYPTPPNGFGGPPQPSPGMPPFGAPAPGGWGAPAAPVAAPVPVPPGWFQVKIPYAQKTAGDAAIAQVKGQGEQFYRANMKWDKPNKRWLLSPQVAGLFQQWGVMPA